VNTTRPLDPPSILISWSMTEPSLTPKTWYAFAEAKNAVANLPQSHSLEEKMGWPAGTIFALEQAFDLHLGRSVGWQLDALKDPKAWQTAARIFRRGVAFSGQTKVESSGTYAIRFEPGKEPPDLGKDDGPRIIDQNVALAWKLQLRPSDLILELDERSKSLKTAAHIKAWIQKHPGEVTVIGGGILSDVAAFAAALLNRPFRLFPTTLLAMVDACVGGKTGVNFGHYGKNQLGLFAFPREVVIAPAWLLTLSQREFFAGLAEGYKHAVIDGDRTLAEDLARLPYSISAIEPHLRPLIDVKAKIISEDASETGRRAVLNFGHTLAHALETISHEFAADDPLLHGEAIGLGMLFALSLSHHLGYLSRDSYRTIKAQIEQSTFLLPTAAFRKHLGLTKIPDGSLIDRLVEGVRQDKKNQDAGASEWVLLNEWGSFVSRAGTFTVAVEHQVLRSHCRTFLCTSGLIGESDERKL